MFGFRLCRNALPRRDDPEFGVVKRNLKNNNNNRVSFWFSFFVVFFLGSVVTHIFISLFFAHYLTPIKPTYKHRNLIFVIGDGFGPASMTLARIMRREARAAGCNNHQVGSVADKLCSVRYNWTFSKPNNDEALSELMPLDFLARGSVITESADSTITDSAAGATAYSCGLRTKNNQVAVDADGKSCVTLLEAARKGGYKTGVVTTTATYDATPASFTAHSISRKNKKAIMSQQILNSVDILLGGGKRMYDEIIKAWENVATNEKPFPQLPKLVTTKQELVESGDTVPLLGIFDSEDMPHELDRSSDKPGLLEMTQRAIQVLDKITHSNQDAKGFVLIIESGLIDIAGHWSDPGAMAVDVLELQATADYIRNYVDKNPETLMILTADHETGGLSIGRQNGIEYPEYTWNPNALFNQKCSVSKLTLDLQSKDISVSSAASKKSEFKKELESKLNLKQPVPDQIFEEILAAKNVQYAQPSMIGELINKQAGILWATHGHTAVDVNLYTYGVGAENLLQTNMNYKVGQFLFDFLDLEQEKTDFQTHLNKNLPAKLNNDIKIFD